MYGGPLGAGLGFVFGAGGVLLFDKSEDRVAQAVKGVKGAVGGPELEELRVGQLQKWEQV